MGGRKVSTILSGDLKLISSLKEVVPHTEEEIYAMLKECNKDPDETVQRLLKEDNFHVVKRKREKKKENAGTVKNASDPQLPNGAENSGRSGRSFGVSGNRNTGKGNAPLRKNTIEQTDGRNKAENEFVSSTKATFSAFGVNSSYSQLVQSQGSSFDKSLLHSKITNGQASPNVEIWPAGPVSVPSSVLQGAWRAGLGRGTIAEMLKKSSAPDRLKPNSTTEENTSDMLDHSTLEQHSGLNVNLSVMGPDLESYLDTSLQSDTNMVEEINDAHQPSMRYNYNNLVEHSQTEKMSISPFSMEKGVDILPLQPMTAKHLESREQIPESNKNEGYSLGIAEAQSVADHTTASTYQGHQFLESKQDPNNNGPHPQVNFCTSNHPPPPTDSGNLSAATSKLQKLNLSDKRPVIIPEHIRVCEADCHMLSFGSFNSGFGNLSVGFKTEEAIHFTVNEGFTEESSSVISDSAALSQTNTTTNDILDQQQPVGSGALLHNNELTTDSSRTTEETLCEKASNTHYTQNFSEANIINSNHESEFAAKCGPLENSTLLQSFDGSTYYNGVFQQGTEINAKHSCFLQGAAFPKVDYNREYAQASVPNTISQEMNTSFSVTNGGTFSTSNNLGEGSTESTLDFTPSAAETATIELSASIPAYATMEPLGMLSGSYSNLFNHQYMLSGLQSPYQPNCVRMGNYEVSSPALGSAGMNSLPPYNSKMNGNTTGGNNMIVSTGLRYARGYSSPQARSFPVDLSVTTGNVTNLKDTISQHFKDTSNVQISSQQMEGSSVWLQNQLAREGQSNNLYSILAASQNQQLRYAQEQSLLLTNSAHHQPTLYDHLYHAHPQQQSGSSSTIQQLLQRQTLASLGHVATQSLPVASNINLYYGQQSTSNLSLQQQLFLQHQKVGTFCTQSGQTQQKAQPTWPNMHGY